MPKGFPEQTHKNTQRTAMPINNPTKPRMMGTLFRERNSKTIETSSVSGSTNPSLRSGSSEELVKLFRSKQYCWKHWVQNEDRAGGVFSLYRARSIAAHCMHLPKFASGELVLGMKPPITSAWAWSKNSCVWFCENSNLLVGYWKWEGGHQWSLTGNEEHKSRIT